MPNTVHIQNSVVWPINPEAHQEAERDQRLETLLQETGRDFEGYLAIATELCAQDYENMYSPTNRELVIRQKAYRYAYQAYMYDAVNGEHSMLTTFAQSVLVNREMSDEEVTGITQVNKLVAEVGLGGVMKFVRKNGRK